MRERRGEDQQISPQSRNRMVDGGVAGLGCDRGQEGGEERFDFNQMRYGVVTGAVTRRVVVWSGVDGEAGSRGERDPLLMYSFAWAWLVQRGERKQLCGAWGVSRRVKQAVRGGRGDERIGSLTVARVSSLPVPPERLLRPSSCSNSL